MKQTIFLVTVMMLLLLLPGIVAAAPQLPPTTAVAQMMAEGESVNPPGWVGGLLAVIALLLPLAFQAWVRQSK